jgi:hypothetical protein
MNTIINTYLPFQIEQFSIDHSSWITNFNSYIEFLSNYKSQNIHDCSFEVLSELSHYNHQLFFKRVQFLTLMK